MAVLVSLPCLLFEDDHLLVVNKPPGMNTHAPAPHASQGLFEWLRDREPRWAHLAIIHRLDKETSGLLLFSKSTLANRSLTRQFTQREVRKSYVFATDHAVPWTERTIQSRLARQGARRVSRPAHDWKETKPATTRFRRLPDPPWLPGLRKQFPPISPDRTLAAWQAEPLTGRTHQIRAQAAEAGLPILGDTLYRGSRAPRLFLHADELTFRHPATKESLRFQSPCGFRQEAWQLLRQSLIDPEETDTFRCLHGGSDGFPGWHVDQLDGCLLSQSEAGLTAARKRLLTSLRPLRGLPPPASVYHKKLLRQVRHTPAREASPEHCQGPAIQGPLLVRENGLQFELRFDEGYSTGLFLDQRENRRRWINGHVTTGFTLPPEPGQTATLLNVFAYTCAFAVCAATRGFQTTSLDLSRKYLDWGRRNFEHNRLDLQGHDFIYGDALQWMGRLARKGRCFDAVILDPPTFSQSKEGGPFRAEKDYPRLVRAALRLLAPKGILFASTNAAKLPPSRFVALVEEGIRSAGRHLLQSHYVPQPPDFPISRQEPAHLKTCWARIG